MSLKPKVSSADHILGNGQADLTIVEYGDYQCPHCGTAHPIIKEMMAELGSQIRFVFRNFPLSEMHPYAKSAALAAEAASLQGKFWEMHDAIFENQNALNDEWLLDMAQKLDLDMDKFRSALKDESLLDRVEGDFESGMMSGVNGTPTFFVNGQKFDGGAEDLVHVLGES
ncbi:MULTISPECIES: thioredoxin domain-containing protein [unclassified Sphingobacterium]|uniref:DsbA family protein n=1 Tax=unclassified Sphingobacterium TaxID=2609468 RepID=UPI001AE6C6B4|nr:MULTISPECIES: thioredoxin domain-containing protein [unclassified Sphingobacterium]MDR6735608.1 protein-disulfide isomerase [Sphingobacterium sp. 2149]